MKNSKAIRLLCITGALLLLLSCNRDGPEPKNGHTDTEEPTWTKPETTPQEQPKPNEPLYLSLSAGQKLSTSSEFLLHGRAKFKDWGVEAAVDFAIGGITNSRFLILESTDSKVTADVFIEKARLTEVQIMNPEIRINLGNSFHSTFDFLSAMLASSETTSGLILPGDSLTVEVKINEMIASFLTLEPVVEIGTSFIESEISLDWFEGAHLRMDLDTFRGTTNLTLLSDSPDANFDALSDTESGLEKLVPYLDSIFLLNYGLLPPESNTPGASWTVRANDLPIRSPSIMPWRTDGSLQLTRTATQDGKDSVTVEVKESGSPLRLLMRPKDNEITAGINPSGTMTIDANDKIVTSAEMRGYLMLKMRSTDHWVFEASHESAPEFFFRYTCKILND